ncbi:DUF6504 family protein [Syntrophothermus lipocalidus]|uniref:DUF6504 domain-containing protein n=1 Tax=Syntrophothermus lipocalidus (strain DSM 12680 / TGB-C1) TaxID=643648 RepID=D7CJ07_SYNLT|nr:DUF6504 family protein [Syntrophothermus lipocalidus]ADI02885.1 conserved hypothetical protein [Syntrophothermus lipocalidus DSM 12680]HOV43539.1 hypothetical protein [Syntrophothermus lipocalidus]
MSRLLFQGLEVMKNEEGEPQKVKWKGRWAKVAVILDRWYDTGCWWESEPPKLFYRLELENGMVLELFSDGAGQGWSLYKIYD